MGQKLAGESEDKSGKKNFRILRASIFQRPRMTNPATAHAFPDTALSLQEALRSFVAADFWKAHEQAASRRKAFPRRIVILSEYVHGPEATAANRIAAEARQADGALKQARQRILDELRSQLLSGKLTAYVRESFPFGPVRPIPPDAWKTLRFTDLRSGRVKGPGLELTGVRIAAGPPCQSGPAKETPQSDTSSSADTPARSETPAPRFSHNHNFTVVRLGDDEFHFGDIQAAVVKELHAASLTPDPWCSGKALLHGARSKSRSLSDIFHRKTDPSWTRLIEYRHHGKYRLRLTPPS
ncbi:hypothetical protein [Mesorhizobium sp. KR2-14]|uniref:hypothetical protein n=1 Tax=Mesorhizobium sp. KR2-14 TaxID=3156610 RepID=UPI0032B44B95